MRYETISYIPFCSPYILAEILETLPESITNEFIRGPNIIYVTVDARKKEIVAYLDDLFDIGKLHRFKKSHHLEIQKDEIDNYDYFLIILRGIQLNRHLHVEITPPTCDYEACPVGSRLIMPVNVSRDLARRLGLAVIGRAWGQEPEILVSAATKQLLQESGIKGLSYEPCFLFGSERKKDNSPEAPFLARPIHGATDDADFIQINKSTYCERHAIIFTYMFSGRHITRKEIGNYDIVAVQGVRIGDEHYFYRSHHLIVSRGLLKILLKNKVSGLTGIGFHHGEKFLPIMPVTSDRSLYNY